MSRSLPSTDLDMVLSLTAPFWQRYSGARLFLTGGTGFIGQWLTQSVQRANDRLNARISLIILTRDVHLARAKCPESYSRTDVELVRGDVAQPLDRVGAFDLCVHAATDVAAALRPKDPLFVFESIVNGTRNVLELAVTSGAKRFLLTSSGAVYGMQPLEIERISEVFEGAPSPLDACAAYGNGKRAAEWLMSAYSALHSHAGFAASSARVFALLGPGLLPDVGFAAGDFIRDVLARRAIRIGGDGRTVRSYLYMSDLMVWLLRILEHGQAGSAYNVGSERSLSIRELADAIRTAAEADVPIDVLSRVDETHAAPRYVPDTAKARRELHLDEYTSLEEALRKTISWSQQ